MVEHVGCVYNVILYRTLKTVYEQRSYRTESSRSYKELAKEGGPGRPSNNRSTGPQTLEERGPVSIIKLGVPPSLSTQGACSGKPDKCQAARSCRPCSRLPVSLTWSPPRLSMKALCPAHFIVNEIKSSWHERTHHRVILQSRLLSLLWVEC